jgi:hypothetical protein
VSYVGRVAFCEWCRFWLGLQRDAAAVLSGLREVYFGEILRGEPFIARFVEHFRKRVEDSPVEELWLVFIDEGLSLQQHLYSISVPPTDAPSDTGPGFTGDPHTGPEDEGSPGGHHLHDDDLHDVHDLDAEDGVHHKSRQESSSPGSRREAEAEAGAQPPPSGPGVRVPSPFWHKLRADASGPQVMHVLIQHLLAGVDACHRRGITHRDIKLSNLILNTHQTVRFFPRTCLQRGV